MVDSLLSGFRALDVTDDKGFVCGKILAALGVDTIKVEPPGGDPARKRPPFYHDTAEGGNSLYWSAFNTDKRSITLDLEAPRGQALFKELVQKADFVLESSPPGYLDGLGLGYRALSRLNPRIILTSITPFGREGPYRHYKGCELVISAMGGVLGNTGDPDRPPVKEALDSCYYHAGVAAALGTLTAHYYREITGQGQQVDVSMQEVTADRSTINLNAWEFDKRLLRRTGPLNQFGVNPFRWIWPCKDGWLYWQLMGGQYGIPANPALSQWIDETGLENPLGEIADWRQFDLAAMSPETLDVWQAVIGDLFQRYTKKEIARECARRGINACVANNPADLLAHPQLRARDYWQSIGAGPGIELYYPKYFFLCNGTENYVRKRAPAAGESNSEIYQGELGLAGEEIAAMKEAHII